MRSTISRDDSLPIEHLVVLEHMPEQYRGQHRAAHNWGEYPVNGAVRVLMNPDNADEHCLTDEYDWIVRDATIHDHCTLKLLTPEELP